MTDDEIEQAYMKVKAKKETKKEEERRLAREKEAAEALRKLKYIASLYSGIVEVFEGELEEMSHDAWWVDDYNYVEAVRDYLNNLPVGCTLRITVEVTGPKD